MITIESQRLKLIALPYSLLQIWHQKGRNKMESKLYLNPSNWHVPPLYQAETADAIEHFWMPQTILNAEKYAWFTNWEIILKSENISIGGIGFGGYPESGQTPMGYLIDGKYQNCGYATEAVNCLMNWAFLEKNLQTILADTPKDNLPSHRVLQKSGFEKTGEGIAEHTEIIPVFHWAKHRTA